MHDNHELSKPPLRGWKFFFFKYVHGKEEPVFTFRYRLLLRHTPFFNFFWDIFFDGRPPGQNEVKDILNMLGLLNALLLTTAVSLMASVNTDELEKADARWTDTSTGYGQYWTYWYAVPPSNQFYFDVCMVLCMFFIGVVGVVWVFADTIGKTGNARDIEYWQDFYKFKDELEKGTVKFGTDHVSHSTLNGKSHEDSKLEGLLLQSSVRLAFDKFRREQHDRQDAKAIMEGTQKGDNAGPKKGPYGSDTTGAVAYDMSYERKIRMTSDTGTVRGHWSLPLAYPSLHHAFFSLSFFSPSCNGWLGAVFQIYWGWAKYCVFMQITTTIFGCIYARRHVAKPHVPDRVSALG